MRRTVPRETEDQTKSWTFISSSPRANRQRINEIKVVGNSKTRRK
jgi:hypothetical protein